MFLGGVVGLLPRSQRYSCSLLPDLHPPTPLTCALASLRGPGGRCVEAGEEEEEEEEGRGVCGGCMVDSFLAPLPSLSLGPVRRAASQ